MTIDEEHPLQFLPKLHSCGHCFQTSGVYTGKMGKCMCGQWECWSTNQDEVTTAHKAHVEAVKEQRKKEEARFKVIRQKEHQLRWRDETFSPFSQKYEAWCSGPECRWYREGSQVEVIAAFQKHQHEL